MSHNQDNDNQSPAPGTSWEQFIRNIPRLALNRHVPVTGGALTLSQAQFNPELPNFAPLPRLGDARAQLRPQAFNRRELRHYQFSAYLDLHGYTIQQAYGRLQNFLWECYHNHDYNILVISGKGARGQDKSDLDDDHGDLFVKKFSSIYHALQYWVYQDPEIAPLIANCATAKPEHGGKGALYLKLRKIKDNY